MRNSGFIVLAALGMLLGSVTPGMADSLLPDIPAAQHRFSETQGCVEPTEEMRRNHMEYILHQRDETMHEGIRDKRHSLDECIDCHVSDAPDAPRVSSREHFCNSCHSYAAVSIDCFQCHADRPDEDEDDLSSLSHHIKSAGAPGTTAPEDLRASVSGDRP
jgi:hypothetical protein